MANEPTILKVNNTINITLNPGDIDKQQQTPLFLYGYGVHSYGDGMQQNMLNILSNYHEQPINAALIGMLQYNDSKLQVLNTNSEWELLFDTSVNNMYDGSNTTVPPLPSDESHQYVLIVDNDDNRTVKWATAASITQQQSNITSPTTATNDPIIESNLITDDSTPKITGSLGSKTLAPEGDVLIITINGKQYSTSTPTEIKVTNLKWELQIPDDDALYAGTYDIGMVRGSWNNDNALNKTLKITPSVPTLNGTVITATNTTPTITTANTTPTITGTFGGSKLRVGELFTVKIHNSSYTETYTLANSVYTDNSYDWSLKVNALDSSNNLNTIYSIIVERNISNVKQSITTQCVGQLVITPPAEAIYTPSVISQRISASEPQITLSGRIGLNALDNDKFTVTVGTVVYETTSTHDAIIINELNWSLILDNLEDGEHTITATRTHDKTNYNGTGTITVTPTTPGVYYINCDELIAAGILVIPPPPPIYTPTLNTI
jgi:hypothetical protein